ncbi:XrtA/PEP-CTERM system TPR-repeat protein PrsT [Roseateles violae]|uniref:PEP-CTERM system TPR-repeat protein PrsT n=1 Tax=Roseateles violae TaxID=3058042 RepID=A0ABT8DQ14_9BURK|nr:XrtA/PEP-CTERM system TPR-repeat protein PrsT [Pelomonas sp. PFR6]MDN3920435.1 PEP-CTERM system TPR-repeat protein PrsT [Pelomonas sp. PFR6]
MNKKSMDKGSPGARMAKQWLRRGGRAAMLATAAGLLLAACSGESTQTLLASAKKHIEAKDSKAAVIQLKNVLQQDPKSAEARFLLGKLLLEGGDGVGAEVELQKALDQGHDADAIAPLLAKALLISGQPDKVLSKFADRKLPQPRAQAELRLVIASAQLAQGKREAAMASVQDALRSDGGNVEARLMRIRLLAAGNDLAGAKDYLTELLAAAPESSEAWQLKGDLLLIEKDQDGATAAYREALQRDKANVSAHGALIGLLLGNKDKAGAEAQLKAMREVAPNNPQTRLYKAVMALENGDAKAAIEETQQLLKRSPNDLRVLQLAGSAELQRGGLVQAEAHFSKAVKLAPELGRARLLLAQTYLRMGEPAKVVKLLQPMTGSKSTSAEANALTAQAFLMQGDPARAEAHFAAAAQLNPKDTRSRTALALAQVSKGHAEQGLDELKAISAVDTGPTADLALISTYLRKKDYERALKAIDKLESKQPGVATASILRGQVELQRGRREQARAAFEAALKIDSNSFPAGYNLASLDISEGKPELAQQRFEKMIEADAKNMRAYMALLALRAQQGAGKDELVALATRAVKANPTEVMPRLALVKLRFDAKDMKPALAAAQEGVAAFPDNAEMLDLLGQILYVSGDVNQAISTYNNLAGLQSSSPQAHLRLGEIYLGKKDYANAAQSFRKALVLKPELVPAQRGLASAELAAGRSKEAITVARTMQGQRGNEAQGHLLEGDIESSQKNWSAAIAAYRTGLEKKPSTELAIKLHRAFTASGKPDEAAKFEQAWLKQHAQDVGFVFYLGDAALNAASYEQALKRYQAVLQLQPDNAAALNNVAWLLNRAKQPGAQAYAEKAIKLAPKEPAFMDTLAEIYASNGQAAKALETQKAAVEAGPDNANHRLRLARMYVEAGDKEQARSELNRLAALGDKFAGQAEVKSMLAKL